MSRLGRRMILTVSQPGSSTTERFGPNQASRLAPNCRIPIRTESPLAPSILTAPETPRYSEPMAWDLRFADACPRRRLTRAAEAADSLRSSVVPASRGRAKRSRRPRINGTLQFQPSQRIEHDGRAPDPVKASSASADLGGSRDSRPPLIPAHGPSIPCRPNSAIGLAPLGPGASRDRPSQRSILACRDRAGTSVTSESVPDTSPPLQASGGALDMIRACMPACDSYAGAGDSSLPRTRP